MKFLSLLHNDAPYVLTWKYLENDFVSFDQMQTNALNVVFDSYLDQICRLSNPFLRPVSMQFVIVCSFVTFADSFC